ncbi:MAG: M13-type metalloendopeptidase [Actinomycetes bacterium]
MKSGIDREYADPTVRPQDDLFRHVNGGWLATAQIPPDRARDGEFMRLHDEAEKSVRAIIERLARDNRPTGDELASTDEEKIGVLYGDFMDEARIEAAGAQPISAELARIAAVGDRAGFGELLGRFQRTGVAGPLHAWVDTDDTNSAQYILNFSQGGITLPDESYYREEAFADIRAEYQRHIERMFALAEVADPAGCAATVWALESRLASAHWDRVKTRDVSKTYNPMTESELRQLAPNCEWDQWLLGVGAGPTILASAVVRQPSFLASLSAALQDVPLDEWKTWLSWNVIHGSAPYLSSAFVEENFAFFGRTLTGAQEVRERWKRGVALTEAALGEALGKIYVNEHFGPKAKERTDQLVAAIVAAYAQNINGLDWMTEQTKAKALAKLALFNPKIGYPNRWRDYSGLRILPGDLLGNVRRTNEFETNRELNKLGAPVDRDEWFMLPQTVNAYYNPGMNEIVFPAAILQPPFFDPDAEDAVNFGGIGAVIGHEISHGFDDQGSKYDGLGNLNNWWTQADRDEFERRADMLIAQFDGYETAEAPGHKVNGSLTVGENIGDLGGLTIAATAYLLSLDGSQAPVIDGLTGMQRLLFNWARVWRGKSRPEEAIRLLAIDPHSPPDLRANATVRNLPQFYEAFDVQPGDGLWLDPDARVSIW